MGGGAKEWVTVLSMLRISYRYCTRATGLRQHAAQEQSTITRMWKNLPAASRLSAKGAYMRFTILSTFNQQSIAMLRDRQGCPERSRGGLKKLFRLPTGDYVEGAFLKELQSLMQHMRNAAQMIGEFFRHSRLGA